MEDEQAISRMKDDYRQLKEKLRQEQPAAEKAATEILSFLKN